MEVWPLQLSLFNGCSLISVSGCTHQGGWSWSTWWGLVSEKDQISAGLSEMAPPAPHPSARVFCFPLHHKVTGCGFPIFFHFYFSLDFSWRVLRCAEGREGRTRGQLTSAELFTWRQFRGLSFLSSALTVIPPWGAPGCAGGNLGLPWSPQSLGLSQAWGLEGAPQAELCVGMHWDFIKFFWCYFLYSDLEERHIEDAFF